MVFFSCENCGENVKKQQVDKHLMRFKCQQLSRVSCLDCGKIFIGQEYVSHTKCISEDEKYSGKLYDPSKNINKGEIKQEQWTQKIQNQLTKIEIDGASKQILQSMLNYPNIPRKFPKFEKFMNNSLNIRDQNVIKKIWGYVSANDASDENQDEHKNGNVLDTQNLSKRKAVSENGSDQSTKKLKDSPSVLDNNQTDDVKVNGDHQSSDGDVNAEDKENHKSGGVYDMDGSIKNALESCKGDSISFDKLYQKILKRYKKWWTKLNKAPDAAPKSDKQILKRVKKTLAQNFPHYDTVDGDVVKRKE